MATALGPYLVVAILAFTWALIEVVQTFRSDLRRALRSGWSWLLIGANLALALLAFALVHSVFRSAHPYFLALAGGAGWQALLRTRINLFQPLNPELGEAVSLSLADLYARLQQFCWERIDRSLLSDRIRLLDQAMHQPIEKLEQQARLLAYASVLYPPEQMEAYLEKLRGLSDQARAITLASLLLREGGYDFLRKWLEAMKQEK